jgi:hypothetical protein
MTSGLRLTASNKMQAVQEALTPTIIVFIGGIRQIWRKMIIKANTRISQGTQQSLSSLQYRCQDHAFICRDEQDINRRTTTDQ